MTVEQLIELLSQFEPELEVVVNSSDIPYVLGKHYLEVMNLTIPTEEHPYMYKCDKPILLIG